MKYLPLLLVLLLFFTSCEKPPEKMNTDAFFGLVKSNQIDKVTVVNEEQVKFTIKNNKNYPMGKWFVIDSLADVKGFEQQLEQTQANFTNEVKIHPAHESNNAFLRGVFNYLLPILVLVGLVAGFYALTRNRS